MRSIPEFNSASLADIAFMLLIFFIVATTINVDTGKQRKLPPASKADSKTEEIKDRNVLKIYINSNNEVMIEDEIVSNYSEIRNLVTKFYLNENNEKDLPEKLVKNIPILGEVEVSQGLISLQNDRSTSYEKYLAIQDEIDIAIENLRNSLAKQRFGMSFEKLNSAQKDAISQVYKLSVSEAEPFDMTKKK